MKRKLNIKKRKKGFTLIELLAVIIILAIIALIATPIILGIVEDARKDSFMRSVELVINATDIDIFNKNYTDTYTYTIEDGNISNLEIGVKNTEGMNGSITYDKNGNDIYAIHNGKYCVIKTSSMNKAEIKDYNEEECSLSNEESLDILLAIQSKVPNENDIETYQNGQLINLGEYGIRYQGADPDNYIYFNCTDYKKQTSETCEIWRIIGIVDGKVKIIRSDSIGSKAWNTNGNNNWTTSTLNTYLNGEYYNNLTEKTRTFISPSTWYLKVYDDQYEQTKMQAYEAERISGIVYNDNPETVTNTNVGLMYPSDYGYAAMENSTCLATTALYYYEQCTDTNWLYIGEIDEWTLSPSYRQSSEAFRRNAYGCVSASYQCDYYYIFNSAEVRPTVYLSSSVQISGEGTPQQPYKIK